MVQFITQVRATLLYLLKKKGEFQRCIKICCIFQVKDFGETKLNRILAQQND